MRFERSYATVFPKFQMALPAKRASSAESLATISNVVLSAAIVLGLYFGRELLVPMVLSILLTLL